MSQPQAYKTYLICPYTTGSGNGYYITKAGFTIQNYVASLDEAKKVIDMLSADDGGRKERAIAAVNRLVYLEHRSVHGRTCRCGLPKERLTKEERQELAALKGKLERKYEFIEECFDNTPDAPLA